MLRIVRIAAVAGALRALFALSAQVNTARGNSPLPGLPYALGVLSLLFFVRALVMERGGSPGSDFEKDLLWGLAAGGVLCILSHL